MQARQVSNFIPHLRNNNHHRRFILLIGQGVVGYDPFIKFHYYHIFILFPCAITLFCRLHIAFFQYIALSPSH
jgi:hypothetical protein